MVGRRLCSSLLLKPLTLLPRKEAWRAGEQNTPYLPTKSIQLLTSCCVFLCHPRKFMAQRQNCRMIKAQAPACQPHTAHSTLLAMKQQKPIFLLLGRPDPMHHAASTVISMAGHSNNPIQCSMKLTPTARLISAAGYLPASCELAGNRFIRPRAAHP